MSRVSEFSTGMMIFFSVRIPRESTVSKFSTTVKMVKMVMAFIFVCEQCQQVQHGGEGGDDVCLCV